ncbi:hypothetical protein GCM10027577_50880 [Spirosoma fluminis]
MLPIAIASLLLGIFSGLGRLGWNVPLTEALGQHGALMIGSFLATLILLERAVVFKTRWALVGPALNGLSLPAYWLNQPALGHALLVAGSLSMALMTYLFLIRHRHSYYYVLFGGSVCLVVGHILLLNTGFYPLAAPWWIAFLLLTIVAERLELSRFLPVTIWQLTLLWLALALFVVSLFLPFHGFGGSIAGVSLLLIATWLLRYDMAFKSIRKPGQPRYSGIALIVGYGWLLVSGGLFLLPEQTVFWYDAALHSFFLGFVFSMIFAHAPIILPGILGQHKVLFHPAYYGWIALNSLALFIRLMGDWHQQTAWRATSGIMQAVALIGFFGTVAVTAYRILSPAPSPESVPV